MRLSRQLERSINRQAVKNERRVTVGHVSAQGKSKLQMNPLRKAAIHGLSIAMQDYFNEDNLLSVRMEALELARTLNNEWIDLGRGKGRTVPFLKSVANFKDNTNPVGHFS